MTSADPRRSLPILGSLPAEPDHDVCITCGDVAVALEVVELLDDGDARCRADDGGVEVVATELVDGLVVGDRVLVHARVALEKLPEGEGDA